MVQRLAGDVFPEEFRHWLCADPRIGPLFEEMHADLLRADYWRELQTRIKTVMWKMSMLTGVSSVLACAMAPTVSRIRHLRRHPARCADQPDGATLIRPT